MPEFPIKPTQSKSTAQSVGMGSSIPVVHSLNGAILVANGWLRVGNEYHKDGKVIRYNGVQFRLGDRVVQFLEDINE